MTDEIKKLIDKAAFEKKIAYIQECAKNLNEPEDNFRAEAERLTVSFIGGADYALSLAQAELTKKDEEIARLRNIAREYIDDSIHITENIALRASHDRLVGVVEKQANDPALWCLQTTASEAYLQQELRKLHAMIEQANDLTK